ncbi:MAG: hypothetical protein RL033_7320 [Pseudomonadota bacterium]
MTSGAVIRVGSERPAPSIRAVVVLVLLAGTVGCGNAIYAARITQASEELARAEQLGAEARAPYEYHYALEHLRKARSEAMEADYGDAIALARVAYDYANRAVQVAQHVEPATPALPSGHL